MENDEDAAGMYSDMADQARPLQPSRDDNGWKSNQLAAITGRRRGQGYSMKYSPPTLRGLLSLKEEETFPRRLTLHNLSRLCESRRCLRRLKDRLFRAGR